MKLWMLVYQIHAEISVNVIMLEAQRFVIVYLTTTVRHHIVVQNVALIQTVQIQNRVQTNVVLIHALVLVAWKLCVM